MLAAYDGLPEGIDDLTRDEDADLCTGKDGQPEADPELRDHELVPLKEDWREYVAREVTGDVPKVVETGEVISGDRVVLGECRLGWSWGFVERRPSPAGGAA